MSEFNLKPEANISPTTCRFCGTHEGPFIDTNTDDDHYGHVWICAPIEKKRAGCAGMIAIQIGFTDQGETSDLKRRILDLEAQLSERGQGNYWIQIPWEELEKFTVASGDPAMVTVGPPPTNKRFGRKPKEA